MGGGNVWAGRQVCRCCLVASLGSRPVSLCPCNLPQKHEKARRELAGGEVEDIDENFIRLYWEQMLQARVAGAD